MKQKFAPTDLGLACIDDTSRRVDGFHDSELGYDPDAGFDSCPVRVIHPVVTLDAIDDVDSDLAADLRAEMREDGVDLEDESAVAEWMEENDATDRFTQSDRYHEWADSHWPMMNFLHPVTIRYGDDVESLATRIAAAAPNVTLLELDSDGDSYAFALTGGGMDLSDNLAAAYIAAGHVPPYALLQSRVAQDAMPHHVFRDHWQAALIQAAELFARRSEDMRRRAVEYRAALRAAGADLPELA